MAALERGTRIGNYEVRELIGSGGMGEVYRAHDARLARDVALKVLRADGRADADWLRRFEQEARLAGGLSHPGIVAVHDVGTHEGQPFLVCELLSGESLRAALAGGPLPVRRAVEAGAALADALAAAHAKGIVHRDLKPENVFVTRDGRVKILDFGIAKATGTGDLAHGETAPQQTASGAILGTVGYMAPEQVRGRPADARSDIFALGAVLHELLAGARPFRGDTAVEVAYAILNADPPELPESVPPGIARVVRRCLEKDPERRYQSARDLAFQLEALRETTTRSGVALPEPLPPPRRRGLRLALLAAALLCWTGAIWVAGRRSSAPRRPPVAPAAAVPTPAAPAAPRFTRLTHRRGLVGTARFTVGRNTILYGAAWDGQPMRIYEVGLDGRDTTQVAPEGVGLFDVAASGELLVARVDPALPFPVLGKMKLGGPIVDLSQAAVLDAAWLPDGRSVAALTIDRSAPASRRIERPLGTVVRSTDAPLIERLAVAPDGRVAFTQLGATSDSVLQVHVLDAAGQDASVGELPWPASLAWRGDELWAGGEGGIVALGTGGSRRTVLPVPGLIHVLEVDADGRVLAELVHRERAMRLDGPAGGFDVSFGSHSTPVAVTSDGRSVVLIGTDDAGKDAVLLWRAGDDAPAVLGEGTAGCVFPDGKRLVALSPADTLAILPLGPGTPAALPRGPVASYLAVPPCVTADGAQVLFLGSEAGRPPRVWRQPVAGGDPTPVTPEGKVTYPLVASADELFAGDVETAGAVVYPFDGGPPHPLAGVAAGSLPTAITSDGRRLYLQEIRASDKQLAALRVLDRRTGIVTTVEELSTEGGVIPGMIAVSPDGKAIVRSYSRSQSVLYLIDGLR